MRAEFAEKGMTLTDEQALEAYGALGLIDMMQSATAIH